MSDTGHQLWVSTVLLSTRNVDALYACLMTRLRNAGLDVDKLFAPGVLRSYLHDTLAYTWYKSAGPICGSNPSGDPKQYVDLLNKVVLRQVSSAIERQHREVKQVGLSGFPASYVKTCRVNGGANGSSTLSAAVRGLEKFTGGSIPVRLLCAQRSKRSTDLRSLPFGEQDVESGRSGAMPTQVKSFVEPLRHKNVVKERKVKTLRLKKLAADEVQTVTIPQNNEKSIKEIAPSSSEPSPVGLPTITAATLPAASLTTADYGGLTGDSENTIGDDRADDAGVPEKSKIAQKALSPPKAAMFRAIDPD